MITILVLGLPSCGENSGEPASNGADSGFSTEKMEADLAGVYEEIETGKSAELTCDYSENVMAYIRAKSQANVRLDGDNLTKTHFGARPTSAQRQDS